SPVLITWCFRNDLSNVGNCWCSSIFMVIVGPTFRYAGLSCCSFEVWGANLVWTNCQMYHYKFLR
ncbi:Os03g0227800, partial [Oryza sativa Japonica Group]